MHHFDKTKILIQQFNAYTKKSNTFYNSTLDLCLAAFFM